MFPPPSPALVHMGALAALRGVEMERISQQSRYLAVRLAMIRQVADDGEIQLTKVPSAENLADIFTKPLTGKPFRHQRALVLGLDERNGDPFP